MGLTSAMYTGLTGLNVNQRRIQTIGNNVANVNTTAYKSFRTLFETQFSQHMTLGTAPSETSGGTNPQQIGHGAVVGATQRTTTSGAIETTGVNTDMAIEGEGYFIVQSAAGSQYYTRDGAFSLNSRNELVNANGMYVRGFAADASGAIADGELGNLTVPLGTETTARASTTAAIDGDLSAAEVPATAGATLASQRMVDGGGGDAAAGTALGDLRSAGSPDVALFADGDTITVSGATKGERDVATRTFTVGTDGSTLGDFATWLQDTFGIQPIDDVDPDAGVRIEAGQLIVQSNAGEPHALQIDVADVLSTNDAAPSPLQFTTTQEARGGGVTTTFTVYDSLGNSVPVRAIFTLESLGAAGPVWRYHLESNGADGLPQALGTGTVLFDPNGKFLSAEGNEVTLDRTGSGAASPLSITLDFSQVNGLSTNASDVILADQDGYPAGTLVDFGVGADGVIVGTFSNGTTRNLGQIALATFSNSAGLVAEAENLFSAGPNSGQPAVKAPGTLGAGAVRGGALESSNVDLSREFIGLITSSTGFQASSRVITTANEMLEQLLLALR